MEIRISDSPVNLAHLSNVIILIRQKGDSNHQIKMLQNCDNRTAVGVTKPVISACPHCEAIVQHTADFKHKYPCKKGLCFICSKTKPYYVDLGYYGMRAPTSIHPWMEFMTQVDL